MMRLYRRPRFDSGHCRVAQWQSDRDQLPAWLTLCWWLMTGIFETIRYWFLLWGCRKGHDWMVTGTCPHRLSCRRCGSNRVWNSQFKGWFGYP